MKNLLVILIGCCSLNGFGQNPIIWNADTVVNEFGDTTILPEVVLNSIGTSVKYDSVGNLLWKFELVSNDTVKHTSYYPNGNIEKYVTVVLDSPIDSISHYNVYAPFKFVREIFYWENGQLRFDHKANTPHYKSFDNMGRLEVEADSCNADMLPIGMFKVYDPNTSKILTRGEFVPCPCNGITCCENGLWEYFEDGVLVETKMFDKGELIWTKKVDK